MPKRVLDFDAMWGSDKLAACAEWAQAEYAWLYGLADASGCFELTNLRVIWGRVAAIRRNLTIERLEQIFAEFEDKGLLFAWGHEGKRYGHWTGSDVPGRLPPPSWRMRLERLAPPVPKQALAEYVSKYARGRAGLAGAGFAAEGSCARMGKPEAGASSKQAEGNLKSEISDLRKGKGGVEEDQGQDWNWNLNEGLKKDLNSDGERDGNGRATSVSHSFSNAKTHSETTASDADSFSRKNSSSDANSISANGRTGVTDREPGRNPTGTDCRGESENNSPSRLNSQTRPEMPRISDRRLDRGGEGRDVAWGGSGAVAGEDPRGYRRRDKEEIVAAELRVGQGPVCGPVRVKPEALERIRRRDAARGGSGSS